MSRKFYLTLFAFVVLSVPFAAHAAFGTLIPPACNCDQAGGYTANGVTTPTSAPAWGCILATFQNAMTMAVELATVLISIFIALAGFTYMTSGGSAEKRQLANKRLMNAVIGLLIVLGAYLLVDSLMKVIYHQGATDGTSTFGPWNSILGTAADTNTQCLAPTKPPQALPALTGALAGTNGGGGSGSASTQTSAVSAGGGSSGLNIQAAVSWLTSNVTTTQSKGICLTDIQHALSAGGLSLQCGAPPGHSGYAGYCNSSLQALNFTALGSSDSSPQPGDILVIQHSAGTQIGHITMWTGSAWVSDFVQSNGESPPGNPYGSDGNNPQYWRP